MHYAKVKEFDIANGPGIRTSLFVSGCSNHCKGCFQPETWNPFYGQEFTRETIEEILKSINNNYCAGLSILGGDPLEFYNLEKVLELIQAFRKQFKNKKTIWMWTGYTIEEIMEDERRANIVKLVDILVEGPFILEKRNLKLKYRGSSNQQIIDMQASQIFNSIILKEEYME